MFVDRECPHCGQPILEGALFCLDCGGRILAGAPTASGKKLTNLRASQVGEDLAALPTGQYVFVVEGVDSGTHLNLAGKDVFVIGREEADLPLQDPFISRHHAEIRADGRRWLISDLKSTNGSFVNDQPAAGQELMDGDLIEVGYSTLVFRVKL